MFIIHYNNLKELHVSVVRDVSEIYKKNHTTVKTDGKISPLRNVFVNFTFGEHFTTSKSVI
jgi:hypothetical protein